MKNLNLVLCAFLVGCITSVAQTFKTDMVFDAMDAEIQRSMRELTIGDLARPYHIEALLKVRRAATAHAVLGIVEDRDSGLYLSLSVRVRVGTPKFDNTNFFDVSLGFFGSADDEESYKNRRIPFELDETTLRRELWLALDAAYKQSVEAYAKKESALKNRTRTDTTWDFAFLPGNTVTAARELPRPNQKAIVETVEKLSAIFRSYPTIQTSRVGMEVVPEEQYYVNSEGRRFYKTESFTGIEVIATTQAADGMPLAQTYAAYAPTPQQLPNIDSLQRAVTGVATRLAAMVDAPLIEPYSGPVLFVGSAAAGVVGQFFAPNLVAQRQPLSEGGFSTGDRNRAFQNKIGARVLPEWLSVADVPSRARDNGRPVAGHYVLDEEGLQAEDITLVDKGYLKTLLSSRVPTKRIAASNGHLRGGGAMFSVIDVTCSDPKRALSAADLKKRLLKLLKDRDLPYGIIVRNTMDQNLLFTGVLRQLGSDLPISQGDGKIGLLEAYRVFPDGREELLRGVEAAGISPATFKDILAVSRTTTVHNFLAPSVIPSFITGGSSYLISTVICPDLLFEDCEVRPLEGDMPKPPSLTNPIAGE